MFKVIRYMKELANEDYKKLVMPIILSVFDSILNSCMYGVMLFLLLDLSTDNLDYQILKNYTLILIVIFLLRCIAQAISFTQAQCIGSDVSYKLRLRTANHLHKLYLGYFNKNSIGKLTGTLITDVNDFEAIITHCLCDIIKVISFTTISLILAFWLNITFGVVLAFLIVVAFPLLMISGNISARNSAKLRTANNQVTSRTVEYINGMKTFRLYNLIGNHFTKLDETLQELKKISTKSEISILPFALSFSVVTSFIVSLSLILGIYLFTVSRIDSATFLVLILLSVSVSGLLNVLSSLYPQVRSISKASENILSILHTKPLPYKMDNTDFSNFDIEFSDVSFQYTDTITVLQNVSFKAKQGTTTALIGPSGSGKTTVVSLIARFWDIQNGTISIGNKNIKDISPDVLTQYMSIVFQDVYLLNDTVFNNIRLGKPDATMEEVIQASKEANCHEFILQMEHGYDTVIGEGGSTLSGGEKQRISIARALLKNSPIVLLDETTSNLDADNEYEIQSAFNHLMKDKTVFVIAHRLETIVNADNILVLDKGIIKEQGNHQKLLKQNGWYAKMYEEQRKAQDWKVSI